MKVSFINSKNHSALFTVALSNLPILGIELSCRNRTFELVPKLLLHCAMYHIIPLNTVHEGYILKLWKMCAVLYNSLLIDMYYHSKMSSQKTENVCLKCIYVLIRSQNLTHILTVVTLLNIFMQCRWIFYHDWDHYCWPLTSLCDHISNAWADRKFPNFRKLTHFLWVLLLRE